MEFYDFYRELGTNIRTFRKLQNITQSELARRLNKSLACISKYERGEVSVDALTIYEIADALSISPQMLLPNQEKFLPSNFLLETLPAIFKQRFVYVYLYVGERKEIVPCCLEIQHDNAHVVVYVDLSDQDDYKSCKYIMTGEIACCETNVMVTAKNPLIHGDYMLLCFNRVSLVQNHNVGICTTVTPSYSFRSLKCVISAAPVHRMNQLEPLLILSKEELMYIRKNHSLDRKSVV